MLSDDALYAEFLAGKADSFDELMIRYGDKLTLYLKGYLTEWKDAEDMMIEAFSRIMFKKPKIEEGNFKVYLFKVGRNLVASYYRRFKKIDSLDVENIANEAASPESLEESYWNEEKKRILHLCLDRIDPATREAIWLVYFENMSYEDAAAVMKVNSKKINNLLTRGKEKLREELAAEGIDGYYP